MDTLLVLAATEADGSLAQPALEALGAATALAAVLPGAQLAIGLFGASANTALRQIGTAGAARVLATFHPELATARYATDARAAAALVKAAGATLVLAPGTSRLNRCLPGVAARLGGRADTHVTGLSVTDGAVTVNRWYYRQRMEGVLTRTHRPWFILVDPGSQPATPSMSPGNPGANSPSAVPTASSHSLSRGRGNGRGAGGEGQPSQASEAVTLESVAVDLPAATLRTTVIGFREPVADAQTIRPDAKLLFVAGAGWTKKQADGRTHVPEAEQLILGFLKAARASLGSSKSLVDLGGEGQAVLSFLSHLNQVGQTGATPRHEKGLSTCCHGEEPHTVGWRFIGERRAISLDPGCGWARGKADVLYVADAFRVIALVNEALATAGDRGT